MVANAFVQYVIVRFGDEPAVTAEFVRSTVEGKQTAEGFVTTSNGAPCFVITTPGDSNEIQPEEVATVKVNIPVFKSVIILLVPDPCVVTSSG